MQSKVSTVGEISQTKISAKVKVNDEIIVKNDSIKSNKKYLYCDQCCENYEDYCTKCGMLKQILNKDATGSTDNRAKEEIPKHILKLMESSGHFGVFALKMIPEGVKFGPFTGLNISKCSWKIKEQRIITEDDPFLFVNWMQYIKLTKNTSEKNLLPFQSGGNLYYRSVRKIQQSEELLVYFGEEYVESSTKNIQVELIPNIERDVEDIFACTFCCFGYSSKLYLINHKRFCSSGTGEILTNEDIAQCPSCKIYMEQKEYLEHHINYCHKNNGKKRMSAPINNHTIVQNNAFGCNKRQCKIYKCVQCHYKTAYMGDFRNHINNHYQVKVYSCTICHRRFKRKANLKYHKTNVHVSIKGTEEVQSPSNTYIRPDQFRSKCKYTKRVYDAYMNSQFGSRPSLHEMVKRNLKRKYGSIFKGHKGAKRSKVDKYNCPKCDYQTIYISCLRRHLLRHEEVKLFKCSDCNYETNHKSDLQKHINAKHCIVKNYNCSKCKYKTPYGSNLSRHLRIHETVKKEVKFNCSKCPYETNCKSNLRRHINMKHCERKKYKCSKCAFETVYKTSLETHLYSHAEVKHFKCSHSECKFQTNSKISLREHVNAQHCQAKYKCSACEYETAYSSNLRRHLYVHGDAKRFKCSECRYETNYKSDLKHHTIAKHRVPKKYGCLKCDYETYNREDLKKHVCTDESTF